MDVRFFEIFVFLSVFCVFVCVYSLYRLTKYFIRFFLVLFTLKNCRFIRPLCRFRRNDHDNNLLHVHRGLSFARTRWF